MGVTFLWSKYARSEQLSPETLQTDAQATQIRICGYIFCLIVLSAAQLVSAQQQEQFTANSPIGRLVFGKPQTADGPLAKSISASTPPTSSCPSTTTAATSYSPLYNPNGMTQKQLIETLGPSPGLDLLSSETRNNQKVVTIVHVLRWADAGHTTVAFQTWYKYDPARRYGWAYVTHTGLDVKGSFIGGKQDFRLVYIHLDSKICDDGQPESVTATNTLVKNVTYTIKTQKQQPALESQLSTLATIISPLSNLHAPEAGYYSVFEFHSNFKNSTLTVSASFDTSGTKSQNAPAPQVSAQSYTPIAALGVAATIVSRVSSPSSGSLTAAQQQALDKVSHAIASATPSLSNLADQGAGIPTIPTFSTPNSGLTAAAQIVLSAASSTNTLSDAQQQALQAVAQALLEAASAFATPNTTAKDAQTPKTITDADSTYSTPLRASAQLLFASFQPQNSQKNKPATGTTPGQQPASSTSKPQSSGNTASTSAQPQTAANSIASQTYTNQPLQWFSLSAVVPLTSYKDLSYNSTGGNLQAQTVNRQNVYVTANFYYPKIELSQNTFRWLPNPMFGLPLKGQPLRNSLYGFSDGWRWIQPFWGIVLDVQQVGTSGTTSLHNRYVRKGVYGVGISLSDLASKIAGK